MCGLRTRRGRTYRSAASRTVIGGGGGISSRRPRGDNLFLTFMRSIEFDTACTQNDSPWGSTRPAYTLRTEVREPTQTCLISLFGCNVTYLTTRQPTRRFCGSISNTCVQTQNFTRRLSIEINRELSKNRVSTLKRTFRNISSRVPCNRIISV